MDCCCWRFVLLARSVVSGREAGVLLLEIVLVGVGIAWPLTVELG